MKTHKVATKKRQKRQHVLPCLRQCLSEGGRRGSVPVRGRGMCNAGAGAPCLARSCRVRSLLCDWPGLPFGATRPHQGRKVSHGSSCCHILPCPSKKQLLRPSVCNLFCPDRLHPFCPFKTCSVRRLELPKPVQTIWCLLPVRQGGNLLSLSTADLSRRSWSKISTKTNKQKTHKQTDVTNKQHNRTCAPCQRPTCPDRAGNKHNKQINTKTKNVPDKKSTTNKQN